MTFEAAKQIVELAGIFMVLMPLAVMGILAMKWRYQAKARK